MTGQPTDAYIMPAKCTPVKQSRPSP